MSPSLHVTCSFTLTFGVPLGLAIRELWTLRQQTPPPRRGPQRGQAPQKPLPPCLLAPFTQLDVRQRVLEDA